MTKYVTTYTGKSALASSCKFIMGHYYIKNEECFYIKGQWYRINSPNLYKDHETDGFITKKQFNEDILNKYAKGIVEVTPEGELVEGYFTRNKAKNIKVIRRQGDTVWVFNENVLKALNYEVYNGV